MDVTYKTNGTQDAGHLFILQELYPYLRNWDCNFARSLLSQALTRPLTPKQWEWVLILGKRCMEKCPQTMLAHVSNSLTA